MLKLRLTDEQIWTVAAYAVRKRDKRLLGYCDAALRGGMRRRESGMLAVAAAWNAMFPVTG